MNRNYSFIRKIATKLSPKFKIIELSLIVIALVIAVLKFLTNISIDSIFTIPIQLLSILYFLMAFAINEEALESALAAFMEKLSGLSLSVLMLGFLFSFKHFPGSRLMLLIGTANTLIVMFYSFFTGIKKPKISYYFRPVFIRSLIYGSIGVIVILQTYQLINF